VDKVNRKTRSKIMSNVRSKGNKTTEWRLRSFLIREGIKGWRVHRQGIFGNPDFVFISIKVAIFVDGAFWHGAPDFSHFPKSRLEYWKPKIEGNVKRDKKVNRTLKKQGWFVLRFWDYQLKENIIDVLVSIKKAIAKRGTRPAYLAHQRVKKSNKNSITGSHIKYGRANRPTTAKGMQCPV
jgi:DNA mismatch endonuclease, patch repair protein